MADALAEGTEQDMAAGPGAGCGAPYPPRLVGKVHLSGNGITRYE
jgi:hypothetical protein